MKVLPLMPATSATMAVLLMFMAINTAVVVYQLVRRRVALVEVDAEPAGGTG